MRESLLFLTLLTSSGCAFLLPKQLEVRDPSQKIVYHLEKQGDAYVITQRRALTAQEERIETPVSTQSTLTKPTKSFKKEKDSTLTAKATSGAEKVDTTPIDSSQPLAELTPKGDLVHYVTGNNETLTTLAEWYTRDKSTIGKIARLNNLKATAKLSPGDVIVIPSYLVKNKVRFAPN